MKSTLEKAQPLKKTKTLKNVENGPIPLDVLLTNEPVIFKGLVKNWPIVQASNTSDKAAMDYLKQFYNGRATIVCETQPEQNGRLFYNDDLTQLNYKSYKGRIDDTLDAIYKAREQDNPPGFYIASSNIKTNLPGLLEHNHIVIPRQKHEDADEETVSIWIGNATTATCHFDALDNLACCVSGRRRFTLFPPKQIANLYPGPLEPTPGGQVISLVDFENPDSQKHPKFQQALEQAQVAELEPGDALFIPSMWWHHVEGLESFNTLINYWWNDAPSYATSGMNALYLAMLAIRDKPKHERDGWKHLFDYYIFSGSETAKKDIPEVARGFLDNIDELSARKLRSLLINKLNR